MNRILVPTDFSAPAGHALQLAARLAKRQGAGLHLVHSVDVPATLQEGRFTVPSLAAKPPRAQHDLYPEARARMGAARAALERLTVGLAKRGIDATYDVALNTPWRDIARLAGGMDLIVMGTHGAGALKAAFIGSNTQHMVRLAPVPVITLRHEAPARIANAAIMAGIHEKGLVKAITAMIERLAGERTRFHLLHVNTPGSFQDTDTSLEGLRRLAKGLDANVSVNVHDHFSAPEGALAFARRAGMDMLLVPTHGRSGLRGFISASVAETLVNESPVPVMTLRMA